MHVQTMTEEPLVCDQSKPVRVTSQTSMKGLEMTGFRQPAWRVLRLMYGCDDRLLHRLSTRLRRRLVDIWPVGGYFSFMGQGFRLDSNTKRPENANTDA